MAEAPAAAALASASAQAAAASAAVAADAVSACFPLPASLIAQLCARERGARLSAVRALGARLGVSPSAAAEAEAASAGGGGGGGGGAAPPLGASAAAAALSALCDPLLVLARDESEAVREAALHLLVLCAERVAAAAPAAWQLLSRVLPVVSSRVGRVPFAEPAEELRAAAVRLLSASLRGAAPAAAAASAREAVEVLRAAASDTCPAVRLAVAAAVHALVAAVPAPAPAAPGSAPAWCTLAPAAPALVDAVSPWLLHQRAPVRAAAVEAAEVLLPRCGADGQARALAALLPLLHAHGRFDRSAGVRRSLARAAGTWLRSLLWVAVGEELRAALLGLLLGLATDESPEVAAEARAALEPVLVSGGAAELLFALPQLLVELGDWTARARALAARALRGLLAAAGPAAAPHASPIFAALAAAVDDGEPDVRTALRAAAAELGAALPPEALFAVLLPALRGEVAASAASAAAAAAATAATTSAAAPSSRVPALRVAAAVLAGVPADAVAAHLPALIAALAGAALAEEDCEGAAARALRAAIAVALAAVLTALLAPPLLPPSQAAYGDAGSSGTGSAGAPLSALVALEQQQAPPAGRGPALLTRSLAMLVGGGSGGAAAADGCDAAGGAVWAPSARAMEALARADTQRDLLPLLLVLHEPSAPEDDETAVIAGQCAAAVARALHRRHAADLFSSPAGAGAVLAAALRSVHAWDAPAAGAEPRLARHAFSALLRCARPALAGASVAEAEANAAAAVEVLALALAPARTPELRVAALVLVEALVLDGGRNGGGGGGGGAGGGGADADSDAEHDGSMPMCEDVAEAPPAHSVSDATVDAALAAAAPRLVRGALLPCLVWRPGVVAATLRKVALAALLALLRRRLLPAAAVSAAAPSTAAEPSLWAEAAPLLRGALTDDAPASRRRAARALAALLRAQQAPGAGLGADDARALAADLLRGLDDASDAVRAAVAAALRLVPGAVAATAADGGGAAAALRGAPAQAAVDALLLHAGDADAHVAAAARAALTPWAALDPQSALAAAAAARAASRSVAAATSLAIDMEALLATR